MLGKRITLFELLGFKVHVDLSWVFIALLVAWSLAKGFFPALYEGLGWATYWWMGVAGMVGLFFSIIFHEFSHSLVARHYGLPIKGITLFIFGGVAEMEEEPSTAKSEFLMAIAGPLSSYFLAAVFWALARAAEFGGWMTPLLGILSYLAFINGLLATFNLLPAFPLDGGRAFRAVLWQYKGDIRAATRTASQVGTGFAFGLIGLGVLSLFAGNIVGGIWWVLIGLFLRAAAQNAYRQLLVRRALEGEPVRRFMTRDPITVSPETTIEQLVEDYLYRHHHDLYPVMGPGGHLAGCVTRRDVRQVPREDWARLTVDDLQSGCSPDNTIDAGTDAVKALSHMQRTGNSRLMVTENGELAGVLALRDLLHFLDLKLDLESGN